MKVGAELGRDPHARPGRAAFDDKNAELRLGFGPGNGPAQGSHDLYPGEVLVLRRDDGRKVNVVVDGAVNENAAWFYPTPKDAAAEIAGRVAFWRGVQVVGADHR